MWAVANGNVLEIDMESFQSYVPSVRLMTYCKMNALRSNHLMVAHVGEGNWKANRYLAMGHQSKSLPVRWL